MEKILIRSIDERREIAILDTQEKAVQFAAEHFIQTAKISINERGSFTVALSGGSTPKAVFENLVRHYGNQLDWSKVKLFWGDERAVPPDHPQSNYKMAMEAAFAKLPIKKENIFRMKGEGNIEDNALDYERLLLDNAPNGVIDLMILGMGEDGHTASLFPLTHGLHSGSRYAIANYIPEKNEWRMTLTFLCINQSRYLVAYILGKNKAEMLKKVLQEPYQPDILPIQRVGTPDSKLLIITDQETASFN